MKKLITLLPLVFLLTTSLSVSAKSTLRAVLAGKSCRQTKFQTLECDYKIGKGLHINIAGIGQKDASINFLKSNKESDFYASVGITPYSCVIVKRGKKDLTKFFSGSKSLFDVAFISPTNGKVYPSWQTCLLDKK